MASPGGRAMFEAQDLSEGPYDASMKRFPVISFFLLAFSITWVVWLPRAWDVGWAVELGAVWTYGPAIAAVAVALLVGGRQELKRLGRRLIDWRIGLRWYSFIILFPLALALVETGVRMAFTSTSWEANAPQVFVEPVLASVLFLIILTMTDGLGEEVGWRGFALPHLLKGHSALAMSLLLGLVWATWHLPLFWTEGASLEGAAVWVLFARLPATAVIYTWLFQHTRGSVLAAALFHGALNLFSSPPTAADDGMVPMLVPVVIHWLIAVFLVIRAGSAGLDRWPGAPARAPGPR